MSERRRRHARHGLPLVMVPPVKCVTCMMAWSLDTPDGDGARRCFSCRVSPLPKPRVEKRKAPRRRRTKAQIQAALEEILEDALTTKDAAAGVQAARALLQALEAPDPVSPSQEVGGWIVRRAPTAPPVVPDA